MLKPMMEYKIEVCPLEDIKELENLLNRMSQEGWDLYSMTEGEVNDELCYNCIFVREAGDSEVDENDHDLSSMTGFKSQIERLMNAQTEPWEKCKSIQQKIKDKRTRINQIKSLIDSTSEDQRGSLNEEISKNINDLKHLQQDLRDIISPDIMIPKIGEDKLTITLSEELIDLVNPDLDANLVAQTVKARQEMTDELGYVIPRVKFFDKNTLDANEYCINIRGIAGFRDRVFPGFLMYYKDELKLADVPDYAITAKDYYCDKDIIWIPEEKTKDFWIKGKTASEVISANLKHTVIKYIEELLDYTDVNCYLEIVGLQNSYLIENIIPDFLSVAEVKFILTNLVKEQISIKDILYIFEKINDFADEGTKEDLLDKIRISLKRQISASLANEEGIIQAFTLSTTRLKYFEDAINAAFDELDEDEDEKCDEVLKIAIEDKKVEALLKKIKSTINKYEIESHHVVLIVPFGIRYIMSLLISPFMPNIKVIAKEEIAEEYTLEIIEQI